MNKWETEKEQLDAAEKEVALQIQRLQERLQNIQIRKIYLQGGIDALKETEQSKES